MKNFFLACVLLSFSVLANAANVDNSAAPDVRLYALNCGSLDIHDGTSFSDRGDYKHQSLHFADPCFLIKNPKGWLLWDTGLGDQYLGASTEDKIHGITLKVTESLKDQLKRLGLKPEDITYVAISHAHFDHTGNANLFPHATWLIQKTEYESIQQKPLSDAISSELSRILSAFPKNLLHGDFDVFGDGSVKILSTPGHTPGHQSLEVFLPHQGVVILSGDLYHLRKSYDEKLVPTFNISRSDTLSSMARIDGILSKTHGKLLIQHDPSDFASLPEFPNYLN